MAAYSALLVLLHTHLVTQKEQSGGGAMAAYKILLVTKISAQMANIRQQMSEWQIDLN